VSRDWFSEHEFEEGETQAAFDELFAELKGVEPNTTKRRKKGRMDHERKGKQGRRSPVVDYVRSLGPYFIVSEVAEELGVSAGYVRKLSDDRVTQAPSYVAPFGRTHIRLFTEEDVQALREYIDSARVVYTRDEYPYEEEES